MTSEMGEAQKKLDAAVDEFMRETSWNESGALTHWVFVGSQTGFNDEGEPTHVYPIVYKGGDQAPHITVGLLRIGLHASRDHLDD